jgi:hypothetical protein
LPAYATASGFEGERVADLPPAAQAWERLKSLGGADVDVSEAVGPLRWSPANLNAPPAELIGPAAADALRRMSGGAAQMRFVLELARPRGDGLDRDFADAARGLFAQLVNRPNLEPQHAAFYIKALADGPREASDALAPVGPLLLKPGSARWLRGRSFERLIQLGYPQALAARADEAPGLLAGMGGDELAALLDHAMLSPDEALRPPALVSAALRELAERSAEGAAAPSWGSVFNAALHWRLGAAPGADERRLGARSVVRATHALARPLMPLLARRTLRLRGEDAAPAQRLDMLAGALEWVRLEGAAT